MEIPDPKFSIFWRLAKFQHCMFRRIDWILTSLHGRTKIQYNRCLYVETHCALIEYENRKAKPAHYLVQLLDLNNLRDQ